MALTGLTSLPSGLFSNLTALTTLDLSGNALSSLPAGLFSGLTSLETLELQRNQMTSLPSGIFLGLRSLTTLKLHRNHLTSLPSGMFNGLGALEFLEISSNQLSTLPASIFRGLTALEYLELAHNQLTTLPNGVFDGLRALEIIGLNGNELTTLPVNIFDELAALTLMSIGSNRISSLSAGVFNGLGALETLRMEENEIVSLPTDLFDGLNRLEILYIYENELTTLSVGAFNGLTMLRGLDLSSNRLSTLSANLFSGLPALADIDLSSNQIDSLPNRVFRGMSSPTELDLGGNSTDPLLLSVSLEKVGSSQFKALAPSGAPFAIVLPVSVASGKIGGSSIATVTIPAGAIESGTLTVSRTAGTTAAVSVDMGALPALPSRHQGYSLSKSETLPLVILSALASTDATLEGLSLSSGTLSPVFASATTSYTASVAYSVSSVTVTPTTSHMAATVTYLKANGTALADADANTGGHQISLGVGANTFKVKVTAEDDSTTRTYTITVTRRVAPAVTVSYSSESYTATEGGTAASITVTLSAEPLRAVVIPIVSSAQDDATAQGLTGADYSGIPETVTFGSRDTTKSFTVRAINDSVDDDGESVDLSFGTLPDGVAEGVQATASVALLDNDERGVTVSDSDLEVYETESDTYTVVLTSQPTGTDPVTVDLSVGDEAGVAVSVEPALLTFTAQDWDTVREVTVTGEDDTDALSGAKTLSHEVDGSDYGTNGVMADPVAVSVLDDDLTVAFSAATYRAAEGGTSAAVTVELNAAPGREVMIPVVAAAQGGATAQDEIHADYSGIPESVTFAAAEMSKVFTVMAFDDAIDDDGESLELSFGTPSKGVTASGQTTAMVNIDDDDEAAWTAEADSALIAEAGGTSTLTVSTGGVTFADDQTITLAFGDSTATVGSDFKVSSGGAELASPYALTLTAGSTSVTAVLTGLDDTVVDPDETIDVAARHDSQVIGAPVTITIEDDELTSVTLTVSSPVLAEAAGQTSLTVRGMLNGAALTRDTEVALSVSPGPDTEVADFTATAGTLTILADQTSGESVITLTPFNDNFVEGAETVVVGGTSGDLIVTGASVTITDDDVPVWSVSVAPPSIGEAAGSAALTVSAGGVAYEDNQAIELAYSGTATPASDYTAPAGLTLMAEHSSVEGTVAAVADTVADPDETVIIAASHGGVQVGTATVTLTEGICGRTGRVRRALLAAVQVNDSGVAGCGDVTAAHLSAVMELDLSDRNLSMLSAGDFAGLSGLLTLNLKKAQLGALPEGIFAGLSSLATLKLQENGLGSLPVGVFSGLSALADLQLDKNNISALSADVFSGLSSLATIDLSDNSLTALPSGVFSGLSLLSDLNLKGNDLLSLPDGIFAGLDGLSKLRLDGNGPDPLPIAVSLEKVGADQFKAVAPAGAPFGFDLPVTVSSGGQISAGPAAMAAGSVASAPLQVTRVAGTVAAVTADLGVLPDLPSGHRGYVLERDAALPLEVLPRVLSTDTALSALTLSDGTLDPAFASATTSYTASVANTVTSVTVTPQTSDPSATVGYYDAGDAAIEDADGNTAGHQVALAVGENTVKVKVTAEDGASSEIYTMVITRADEVRVSIAAAATPVTEGAAAEFTLTRTGPSDFALTVLVQVSQAGEVLADAAQYTAAAEVTFALGEIAHTLSVATGNDEVDEALSGEPGIAGRITAALQAGAGYAVVADRSSAEIAVEDDDAPDWSVTVSPAEIGEAGGRSILTVSTGGMVTFAEDQTLGLTTSGTATAGDDYTLAGSLTLTAGLTSATATLGAIRDSVAETPETADIAVSHGGVQIGTATVTISDGICGRTRKVREALVTAVQANDPGVTGCGDVTALHLSNLSGTLNLAKMTIRELKADDFAGLSDLEELDLKKIKLNSLPAGIFDDLAALTTLRLQQNALSDLPAGLFAGLGELTDLQLDGNQLAGLEAGDFAGLSKLETLDLEGNRLSTIQTGAFDGLAALTVLRLQNNQLADMPAGLFDDLTQLTELNLRDNQLQRLPDGVFAGLAAVTTLKIDENPTDPMPLTVGLEKVGEDQFKAVVPAGAPFAIELPVSVSSGGAIAGSAASVTIAAGAVESAVLSVTRTAGTTDAVTVNIGALPDDQPATHVGYALRKSANLPLGVLAAAPALPTLSVADPAAVQEGDTTITFTVTLTGTVTGTVTVDYETEDGTALARGDLNPNGDYRAASDTLMFTDEQRTQPVEVTIYADAVNEQQETFKLKLSNPTGATLTNDEATGTITNSGPIPRAWLVRFGRTVAGHVTEGIGERLMQAERTDAQVTFAGVRLPFGEEARNAPYEPDQAGAFGRGWNGDGVLRGADRSAAQDGWGDAPAGSARELTSRDLLLGSSFVLRLGGDAGAGWTLWGRGAATRFDGGEADLRVDGEVATFMAGVDTVRDRWLAGVALAQSRGEGGYDATLGAFERGELTSTLTSVHPYVRFTLSERMTAWGSLGYGRGELELNRGAAGTWDTDTSMQMAALGTRGVLSPAAYTGGFELAVRSDALYTRMTSGASDNASGRLAGSEGNAGRLRLILEGARTLTLGHRTLTPNLELGLRHDAGDAETGTGIELGGGLRYADPAWGLSVEVKARSLIAHQDAAYREWGASAAIRLNPGASGQGLMLTLTPTWGNAASGVERLWSQRDAQGLIGHNRLAPGSRMDAEVGYALNGPKGLGTQIPYAAVSLADAGGRTLRLGWRLAMGPQGRLDLEAMRRQTGNGQSADNGFLLRAALRW